jgi:type I restriction enzyme S subunit
MEKISTGSIETNEEKKIKDIYNGYTYFKNLDIVMAKVTPCFENGNIAIANNLINGVAFGSTEINVFRTNERYIYFVYYQMQENHFVRYGSNHMTGVAGLKRVPTSYFINYRICIPFNNSEINTITNFLRIKDLEFKNIKEKTKTQIEKLKEVKQSLISEAVTGKIDLRDWEIKEEELQ